jgi:hypothetical protein
VAAALSFGAFEKSVEGFSWLTAAVEVTAVEVTAVEMAAVEVTAVLAVGSAVARNDEARSANERPPPDPKALKGGDDAVRKGAVFMFTWKERCASLHSTDPAFNFFGSRVIKHQLPIPVPSFQHIP